MALKVITQNVMVGQNSIGGSYGERRPLLKRALFGADVIGLQEVMPLWKEAFDEDLEGYEHTLFYRSREQLEATPIYWKRERFERLEDGHFWLSETPQTESYGWGAAYPRICSWVRLYDREEAYEFAFVNTHLDNVSAEARVRGMEEIRSFVFERFSGLPVILTGDFNDKPDSETIRVANRFLTDVRTFSDKPNFENTYHGFGTVSGSCIDYVYVNAHFACTRFEVVKEREGRSFQSDHYGLSATLTLL